MKTTKNLWANLGPFIGAVIFTLFFFFGNKIDTKAQENLAKKEIEFLCNYAKENATRQYTSSISPGKCYSFKDKENMIDFGETFFILKVSSSDKEIYFYDWGKDGILEVAILLEGEENLSEEEIRKLKVSGLSADNDLLTAQMNFKHFIEKELSSKYQNRVVFNLKGNAAYDFESKDCCTLEEESQKKIQKTYSFQLNEKKELYYEN